MGIEPIQGGIDQLKEHIVLHLREIHPLAIMEVVQIGVVVLQTEAAAQAGAAAVIHADKGIYMKKILFVTAIFLFLNITGCYTVIWSPGMDFPTADRTSEYNSADTTDYYYSGSNNYGDTYGDVYYSEPYYGRYANYYNIPWWYSIAPPTGSNNNKTNGKASVNRNGDVTPIRSSGDGRGNPDRNTGDIINTPPVSVTGSGSTSTGAGTTSSDPKKTDSSSDNTRQSTNSGSIRNNDGNRNDGGRK